MWQKHFRKRFPLLLVILPFFLLIFPSSAEITGVKKESVGPDLAEFSLTESALIPEYILLSKIAQSAEESNHTKQVILSLKRRLHKYPSAPDRTKTLRQLARAYIASNLPEEAEPLLKEITQIENINPSEKSENLDLKKSVALDFYADRLLLARAYLFQNKVHQALLTVRPLRISLASGRTSIKGAHAKPLFAESLLLEAQGFRLQGQESLAKSSFEQAGQIIQENLLSKMPSPKILRTEVLRNETSRNGKPQMENSESAKYQSSIPVGINYDYHALKISFKMDDCLKLAINDHLTSEAKYLHEIGAMGACLLETVEEYQNFHLQLAQWNSGLIQDKHHESYHERYMKNLINLWGKRQADLSELLESYKDRCSKPPAPPQSEGFSAKKKRRYISELAQQLMPGCKKTVEEMQQLLAPHKSSIPALYSKTSLVLSHWKEVSQKPKPH